MRSDVIRHPGARTYDKKSRNRHRFFQLSLLLITLSFQKRHKTAIQRKEDLFFPHVARIPQVTETTYEPAPATRW